MAMSRLSLSKPDHVGPGSLLKYQKTNALLVGFSWIGRIIPRGLLVVFDILNHIPVLGEAANQCRGLCQVKPGWCWVFILLIK